MLNTAGQRELVYVARITEVKPIEGKDRVECAVVNGGWTCMVPKGAFEVNDLGIYHEIDSLCPSSNEVYAFLEKRKYRIKTQKFGSFYSQGLLMPAADFGWVYNKEEDCIVADSKQYKEGDFLTEDLGVKHYEYEETKKKTSSGDKYKKMAARHPKLFRHPVIKWIYKKNWGKKFLFIFFGKKKDKIATHFPTHFPYIHKTDQERCENMTWVLNDKTPFIVTEKCDGSSGTFILERKHGILKSGYEFYVCSRNVRQLTPDQQSFYDENHYWEVAKKYDIENKLRQFLEDNEDIEYVCWQGEVCAPPIQKNPHKLKETHLFLFHMTDSKNGRWDIRDAVKLWEEYDMEHVPIIDENYILPDDFEEFKQTADGEYRPEVCEGNTGCRREGYVYYKTTDPNFSFKNVSREYLAKH